MSTEWIIGILVAIFTSLLGIVYAMTISHGKKINAHDILFATFTGMNKKIDEFHNVLEKHEEKEEKQFEEIAHRLERLSINVALLKKSPVDGGNND